jgi:hypothetical protein
MLPFVVLAISLAPVGALIYGVFFVVSTATGRVAALTALLGVCTLIVASLGPTPSGASGFEARQLAVVALSFVPTLAISAAAAYSSQRRRTRPLWGVAVSSGAAVLSVPFFFATGLWATCSIVGDCL